MPASRTAPDRCSNGAGAVRSIGFSASSTARGKADAIAAASTRVRRNATPSSAAIASCAELSSKWPSAKPEPERRELLLTAMASGNRRDRGRVQSSTQIRGHLHVGPEANPHRVDEQLLELLDQDRLARVGRREVDVPPARHPAGAGRADDDIVRRRQLANAGERRSIRQGRPHGERVGDPDRVELADRLRMPEQRLRLRGEAQVAAVVREKERPDAEAVPRQEDLAPLAIPHGDREVAVQPVEAADAPLLIRMCDHFRVRRGRELVPQPGELGPELDVVVDLPVLHDPVAPTLVAQGLVAAVEIDDRETRGRHPEPAVEIQADAVRAAVPQLAGHGQQERPVGGVPGDAVGSGDAAHTLCDRIGRGSQTVDLPQGQSTPMGK